MFGFLFKAPALQLVMQADIMTKLVLTALFTLSIFCIWIVLSKLVVVWRQKKIMDSLVLNVKKARSFDDLLRLGEKYKDSTGGRFLVRSLAELKDLLNRSSDKALTKKNIDKLQFIIDKNLDQIISEEERYLPVLGTSAAVSPLVGLFGTVWGLVHAFVDISQSRSADIAVVAPGIAEALTTTLAGLMVAIPALTFFHYFSNELRKMEHQLANVSDKFLSIVKQTFEK